MSIQNMKRSETTEQIALFNWAKRTESILPELALMYHVPNEGKRSNGGILKAAGLKSGVPDICLPVANNGFHGLYIELKFGKNKATKAQEEYMAMLNAQGYKTAVCYGAEEAREEILAYLTEPGRMPKKACVNAPWINGKCDGKDEKGMVIKNDYIARLLSLRPCPEMSTYDFLYRIAVDLVYTSNSFSVIFWNKDFTRVESIQPITTTSYRIFEDDKNNILFRFRWDYDGKTYTVPYQNVIHVKARYNKRRFLGTTPDMELKRSLDLIETSGETIKNIVNRSNSLAGYLKYNNIADDEELKEIARNFQDAYMNKDNAGGIAAIDNTVEFKEISQRTPSIPTNQITFLRDNIYRYYGVNDKILTSTLNDTEFISFYENVIEPISVQLSYEFTFKLLTPREIGYGNRIDFVANLLQYATLQTRETIGGGMFDRGALTINEYRELMYYGPVEDGDQRLVSLNYVKVGDQSLYQVGQQNEPPDDTGANDREKRAMQAAARAYMQIMKGG